MEGYILHSDCIVHALCFLWYTGAGMKKYKISRRDLISLMALLLFAAGFALLYRATGKQVTVLVDGTARIIRSHSRTVEGALSGAEIEFQAWDRVIPGRETLLQSDMVIEVVRGATIWLQTPDGQEEIHAYSSSPTDILAAAGILLYPGDAIWVDGRPLDDPSQALSEIPERIRYQPGVNIQLSDGHEELRITSSAPVLGQALEEAGIVLLQGDRLNPGLETALQEGMKVELRRASPITIEMADGILQTAVAADSVGQALAQAGVSLLGLDYAEPGMDDAVPEDGVIRVVRVQETVLIEQEPLPFETIYEASADLEIDSQSILDSGSFGVQANRVRIRTVDGEEESRIVEGQWIAREPEPQRIGYGTKIVVRSTSTPDGPIEYWRAIEMWATSYAPSNAGVSESNPDYGITACGKVLEKGLVAIDRRYIPFYTQMYVPGYGFAMACDTGGGVKGRWIDLGYEDSNYVPWHQNVTVYFLTPVPPAESISWIIP